MEPRDQKRKQKKKSGFANDAGSRIKHKRKPSSCVPKRPEDTAHKVGRQVKSHIHGVRKHPKA